MTRHQIVIGAKESYICRQSGFTLVELMITLAMTGIIVAAVYAAYTVQQKSYYTQGQVVEMQQNIRAALEVMGSTIRMAGYDPENSAFSSPGNWVIEARPDLLAFAADMDKSGDLGTTATPAGENEYFAFDLYTEDGVSKIGLSASNSTAMAISSPTVGHWEAAGHLPIAEHIERIEFAYMDKDGNLLANPSATGNEADIRSVTISVLAVSALPDPKYTNNQTYTTPTGTSWGPVNDNFRRRLLTQTVIIRNVGL